MNSCEYCNDIILEGDQKILPDDLPDDIPDTGYDLSRYHSWCFEKVVDEERSNIAAKHGADDYAEPTEADEWHSFDPDC